LHATPGRGALRKKGGISKRKKHTSFVVKNALRRKAMYFMYPYFGFTEGGDTTFVVEGSTMKFGYGALTEVGEEALGFGMKRVAVFTDPVVARLSPVATVLQSLRAAGLDPALYDEVVVEPTDASFQAAARFAVEGRFDGFVSVGGGSVMDTCKAANLYSTYPDDFMAYINAPLGGGKLVPGPLKPHIACPTTFGTASESTGLAICDFVKLEVKAGISSKRLKPSIGILDPTNLYTLHPNVVAANGFDVLSHAIESFTARPFTKRPKPARPGLRPLSQGANPYGDIACIEGIRIAGRYIVAAVTNLSDKAAREPLMFASMLAGVGFGNSGCHLPHGMSYAISGLVKDFRMEGYPPNQVMVPHGFSVIVNSPAAFRFTGPACPDRHLRAAAALGADVRDVPPEEAGKVLAERLVQMMKACGVPNGISGVGYGPDDIPALTDRAFQQKRLIDNGPRSLDGAQLADLFRDALRYW